MQRALKELEGDLRWSGLSRVYETAPMYVEDQPSFLNAAASAETDLGPLALLDRLKLAERAVGRGEASRFGPREIDLDLVAYGSIGLRSRRGERELVLPHPRAAERRFVLAPLADVAPDYVFPGGRSVRDLLEATNAQAEDVTILSDAVLSVCGDRR